MEDVSKKWICPKLMGEGEVTTQKFGGGVRKKNKEGTKFQRWARRL